MRVVLPARQAACRGAALRSCPVPSRSAAACLAALPLLAAPQAWAQPAATEAVTLPTVRVVEEAEGPETLAPTTATTVIDAQAIARKQSSTIFDVVKDAPGVSVDGGPRATGMKFNIRGFRGNEDVLFKIDGGVKGFEKYRFGAGVFIEPELIKSVTIERGPSLLTGSGAMGGAVIATTKSAVDLLEPGQRVGGMLKLSYDANNQGWMRMATAYGRPTDTSDLLVSVVRRSSDDFKLASGLRFPASAENSESTLLKYSTFLGDDLRLEFSRTAFTSGPTYTPFDANSSNAFVGGYVHQSVDDETLNMRLHYEPATPWIQLRGTLAHETTSLENLMRTGANESSFTVPCSTSPCQWNAIGGATGEMTDFWRYRIWTAELFNDSRYRLGPLGGVLTVGWQGVRNTRDLRRMTENALMNLPDGKYPGGYDPQQPPGIKTSQGLVVQNLFAWSDWSLTTGLRHDRYRMEATGQAALARQAVGEPTVYRFSRNSRSAALSWRPGAGPWTLTQRWAEAFRPPLITDYFGMDSASPCSGFFDAQGQPLAPLGCGDLLVPTTSVNRELTVAWAPPAPESGAHTQARFTYYRIATESLNGATYLRMAGGRIVQPYHEKRRGVELELQHDTRNWYAQLNLGRITASRHNRLDGSGSDFTAGIPGTTLGATLGYRLLGGDLELGWRVRQIWDQLVIPGATGLTETTQYCGIVRKDGVAHAANTLQDLFAVWRASKHVSLRFGINNLFNKHWCNNGDELGNIIGLQGPGRSVRASVTLKF